MLVDREMDAVELGTDLARLDPGGLSDLRGPPSAWLVGRLVDVAAATEQRLGFLDEPQDRRGTDLLSVVADIHAEAGGWVVHEPDAAADLFRGKPRAERLEAFAKTGLGPQVCPQVVQLDPTTLRIHRSSFAAELDGGGDEIVVGCAPVFVTERVIPDVAHAAEDETIFPVHFAVEVDAESLGGQVIEQRF
jgi:hypothetical protein